MPDCLELLAGILVVHRFQLRRHPVLREFDHLGVDVIARRVEHEAMIGFVPHTFANRHEVDSEGDLCLGITSRLDLADGMALPTIEPGFEGEFLANGRHFRIKVV